MGQYKARLIILLVLLSVIAACRCDNIGQGGGCNTADSFSRCIEFETEINAEYAVVYYAGANRAIYVMGSERSRIYPASVTKLYTARVALRYLNPEEIITAGDELDLLQPGSSIAYIRKGHRLTAEMLIEGMLLPSGNDAAYVLAAAAGRRIAGNDVLPSEKAVSEFVNEMNRQAQSDGLNNTHFTNPDGCHNNSHYSSLSDIIKIAVLSLSQEIIVKYTSLHSDKVCYASGESNTWTNTNKLIDPESRFYRKEVIGLKTGRTEEAGYCLLAAAKFNGSYVVTGVFRCRTSDDRFSDTAALLNECKNIFS